MNMPSCRSLGIRNVTLTGQWRFIESVIEEPQQLLNVGTIIRHDQPAVVDRHGHADRTAGGFDLRNGVGAEGAAATNGVNKFSNSLIGGGQKAGSIRDLEMCMRSKILHLLIRGGAIDIDQVYDCAQLMKAAEFDLAAFDHAGKSRVQRECRVRETAESVAILQEGEAAT